MKRLSFDASVAAVKRKPGETAEHLASRIAADNHSETEQEFSILRAIEEVELDLSEAVRLLRRVYWETANVTQDLSDGVNAFLARVDAR